MIKKNLLILTILFTLNNCGKVGPLELPQSKLDKSVITYPCDKKCIEKFETEKLRQQSVTLQTD
jgi:predicted small lipoprotein YifL